MPGANCAIYGCGACRSRKYKDELKKTLKEGSIPHLKLPKKTLEVKKINGRSDVSIRSRFAARNPRLFCSNLLPKL
eukprot:gene12455-13743_t